MLALYNAKSHPCQEWSLGYSPDMEALAWNGTIMELEARLEMHQRFSRESRLKLCAHVDGIRILSDAELTRWIDDAVYHEDEALELMDQRYALMIRAATPIANPVV